MRQNLYQPPQAQLLGDAAFETKRSWHRIVVSLFLSVLGLLTIPICSTGIEALSSGHWIKIVGSIIYIMVTILPSLSSIMLWRGHRFAWIPIAILALPFCAVVPSTIKELTRLNQLDNQGSLDYRQLEQIGIPSALCQLTLFLAFLLVACAIYCYVVRNDMRRISKSDAPLDQSS